MSLIDTPQSVELL